jgi:PilZ domain
VGYGPRRSSDLSAGGMFIESIAAFPRGTVLELRFRLQDGDGDPVQVKARVLYAANSIGMGVEFLDLPPHDRARIERLLTS